MLHIKRYNHLCFISNNLFGTWGITKFVDEEYLPLFTSHSDLYNNQLEELHIKYFFCFPYVKEKIHAESPPHIISISLSTINSVMRFL